MILTHYLTCVFHKLLLNFTWWVNRKDEDGNNIFNGGFLGLDNIGIFDRSKPLPGGGHINQADGTAWMAMYCLNMMHIALQLALSHSRAYEDIASKFFEHFLYVAQAMEKRIADKGLWSEEDGFYYDVLNAHDGSYIPLKINSMVGLIPLFAVEVLSSKYADKLPEFTRRMHWFLDNRPDLARLVSRWEEPGQHKTVLLSLLRGQRMKQLLARMLDETRFLSSFGVRSLSNHHANNPFEFNMDSQQFRISYEAGESESELFGGNSNWRGPIWFPLNYLLIESLLRFYDYYGDDFKIEYPVGSKQTLNLKEVALELRERLGKLFLRDESGRRPTFGDCNKFQTDPHFKDYILFYEYFHGNTGRGLGASHQTGWTGLIANLLQPL